MKNSAENDMLKAENYERVLRYATARIERVEDLLKRKSSKKWSKKKLQKMSRRLHNATELGDDAYNVLENVKQRLESLE